MREELHSHQMDYETYSFGESADLNHSPFEGERARKLFDIKDGENLSLLNYESLLLRKEETINDNMSVFNVCFSPLQGFCEERNRLKNKALPALTVYHDSLQTCSSVTTDPPHLCRLFEEGKDFAKNLEGSSSEENSESSCQIEAYSKNAVDIYMETLMKFSKKELLAFENFERNVRGKGLKLLSVIVFDIITETKASSYKEVADQILGEVDKEDQGTDIRIGLSREEQNLKRRTYDVLNVLIAAGTFTKEGKRVQRNYSNPKICKLNNRTQLNSMYSKMVG